jgi:hypothetical protein
VTIRKLPRNPEGIDSLKMYGALGPLAAAGTDLQDPARVDEFLQRIRRGVSGSVHLSA